MSSVPPSYNAVVMQDKASQEKEKVPADTSAIMDTAAEDAVSFPSSKEVAPSHIIEYEKGFAENHYKLWMAMRIFLMSGGIVFSCRKSRHIRCHGHGGSCGKYIQDQPCTRRYRSCKSGDYMTTDLEKRSGLASHEARGGCCTSRRRRRHCGRY